MSVLDKVARWLRAETKDAGTSIVDFAPSLVGEFSAETALRITTVLGCVRLIADGVASLPLKLFVKAGTSREELRAHRLYEVLNAQPNGFQSSFDWRHNIMVRVLLTGNAYSLIERARGGEITALLPIPHCEVRAAGDYTLTYVTRINGEQVALQQDQVLHIRGISLQPERGLAAIALAADALGLAKELETAQRELHANGIRPSGVISIEGELRAEQYKALRDHYTAMYAGKPGTTVILDRSAKFTAISQTGESAQTLESRQHQQIDICMAFGVLPSLLGLGDKSSTYASVEAFDVMHLRGTLGPWLSRLEQTMNIALLTLDERRAGIYVKFVEEALLRANAKDTAELLRTYVQAGIMSINEARAKLEMSPVDGLDLPRVPLNTEAVTREAA